MDLRYAVRRLAQTPGFTLTAVVILALGIGLNTVVFTFYNAVAWKPLAVSGASEMVRVTGSEGGRSLDAFSYPEYEDLRSRATGLQAMIATSAPLQLLGARPDEASSRATVIHARLVSDNYFDALGVRLSSGRGFRDGEAFVAVLSHAFWRGQLRADPHVLGKSMWVQGTSVTIVGIAPPAFLGTGMPPQAPDLWLPRDVQPTILPNLNWLHDRTVRQWQILARRQPGVSVSHASAELALLGQSWPLTGAKPIQLSAKAATFFQTDSGEFQVFGALSMILLVAVGLILMMGCVNLINLIIARNAARTHELAIRLALGASHFRLIRQLCAESILLGLLGGVAGLLLALFACEAISAWLMETLRTISGGVLAVSLDLTPDWRVYTYTTLLSALTGATVGVWPAIRSATAEVNPSLKQAGGATGRHMTSRNLLVSAQLASCLILLAGAGLLFRGLSQSHTVQPGFDTRHLLVLSPDLQVLALTSSVRAELLRHVVNRVQSLPEVAAVAWVDRVPFVGHGAGAFHNQQGTEADCLFNAVSTGYFDTLGLRFRTGRNFTLDEEERNAPVVIISESAARSFWPGQDPVGQRLAAPRWLKNDWNQDQFTVIGVVPNVRSTYLSKDDNGFLYFPKSLSTTQGALLVRTRINAEKAIPILFGDLSKISASLPSQTYLLGLEQGPVQLQKLMAEVPALVASVLGLLALVLAAIGVYGVVAYRVTQRTREIGIRVALGASRQDVIRMVLQQSLRPVAWGGCLGLAGALIISRLLAAMVAFPETPDLTYGAGAFHPATFLGVLAVLTGVVLLASLVPVRRATRIEPASALRNE